MFLIKSFEKYLFLEIIPNNWEQKQTTWGLPYKQRLCKRYEV